MSNTAWMTLGFLLIMIGVQLHIVESFTMTPRFSNLLTDQFTEDHRGGPIVSAATEARQSFNSPYYQTSFSQPPADQPVIAAIRNSDRTINPPHWICWPVLFLGSVFILHGATRKN